ncbi:MAG: hypothetical protein WBM02_00205 [bacterium]
MEYGNKILEEVLREIQEMTLEEYDKLHQEACAQPDIEDFSGVNFKNAITFSQIGSTTLEETAFTNGTDINSITTLRSLYVSSTEIILESANIELLKAA